MTVSQELLKLAELSTAGATWMAVRDALWDTLEEKVPGTPALRQALRKAAPDKRRMPWPPPMLLKLYLKNGSGETLRKRMDEILERNREAEFAPFRSWRFKLRAFLSGI